eukprot:TRINITY_DN11854_c0_g1_i1.p1 TRINITY_DN11854_c0_g1~~TRINITY_DN11854_c0_g1_i1.p1  ORF type:complete len:974 (+),score=491.39 TRINITY_DN11854_c0_g1_i1:44-2965(+)
MASTMTSTVAGAGEAEAQQRPSAAGAADDNVALRKVSQAEPAELTAAPTHGALSSVRSDSMSGRSEPVVGSVTASFQQQTMAQQQEPWDAEGGDGEEDPETMIRQFGANPMMDRVQQALYDQLLQTYERVSEELRDKEADMKRTKTKRETVGVELYSLQQQLARLQVSLEQTHEAYSTTAEARAKSELDLDQTKEEYARRKQATEDLAQAHAKNMAELNALQDTLRQVEQYNEEVKGEILVTRRATYKAESAMQGLEKEKGRQDVYINNLLDQVKRLQEQVVLQEAQIASQTGQSTEAQDMIRETAKEMEVIHFEKKQLLQQWRSALVGLARRDEALTAATNALRDAENASREHETEIEGLKREMVKAQAENETLVAVKDRLQSEGKYADELLEKLKADGDRLAETYTMLQRSKAQMEEEEGRVDASHKHLRHQVGILTQSVQTVTRERQKLEKAAALAVEQQSTTSKAISILAKQRQQALAECHEKEAEEANLQNELARVRVDVLNTEAHNAQLRERVAEVDAELARRDRLIARYQLEIRQRADEVEKKMYRVDRLNRRYEKLVQRAAEDEAGIEGNGPLEGAIRNLNKEIDATRAEQERLKHEWLRDQTKLVSTASATEDVLEANDELKARSGILARRRARIMGEAATNEAEAKRLAASIQAMHLDMARLNQLIGKSGAQAAELGNATSNMERDFLLELKALEAESLALEDKIGTANGAKNDILAEIVETERQLLLWGKKIQLEKETQAALDPEAGKGEVKGMEREIHRMRVRLDTLKREQETMIQDMEQAIMKREQIAVRYKGKAAASASKPGAWDLTQAALKKRVAAAQKDLQRLGREMAQATAAAGDRRAQLDKLTSELERATTGYEDLSRQREELQAQINTGLYEKQRRTQAAAARTKMARRLQDIARGAAQPPDRRDSMRIQQALFTAEARLGSVRDTIEALAARHPHLGEVLSRVLALADDATGQ